MTGEVTTPSVRSNDNSRTVHEMSAATRRRTLCAKLKLKCCKYNDTERTQ